MTFIRFFDEISAGDVGLVGGKGLSLALMYQAGLPVPPGFCITSEAYRAAVRSGRRLADSIPHSPREAAGVGDDVGLQRLRAEIVAASHRLGGGVVAVRSSATSEDSQAASFAGQQETVLGVVGDAAVLAAVQQAWDSLQSERAVAYRCRQQPADADAAMAVVVQELVDAEASGVLFTRDPLDATGTRMLVEASWGLGESVVSGRVTPDRFQIDRDTGSVADRAVQCKSTMRTRAGWVAVPDERQSVACLGDEQLRQLAELGRKIEEYFGGARDVEWAWAGGRLYVLQARPITAADAYEREQVRGQEIAALRAKAEPRGTVWARYNLAEILPAPTPMTWSIVRHFMSGRGGYGLMFRDLGFDPDPLIDSEGFIDLVCGRPLVNLSREAKLYFHRLPLAHSFQAIKANPASAFYPQPTADPEGVTAGFLIRLPVLLWRVLRNASRMRRQPRFFAEHLRRQVFPAFAREVDAADRESLSDLSPADLVLRLEDWIDRTLNQFARQSLRPSIFAGNAIGRLELAVKKHMGPAEAAARVRSVLAGIRPDPEADLAAGLRQLSAGKITRDEFLHRFGHRGPLEMELSQPRWRECPDLLDKLPLPPSGDARPAADPFKQWHSLADAAGIPRARARQLEELVNHAVTYSALRETAKHYFMMGYAQIRRCLTELDRRYSLSGGIFYLEQGELAELIQGAPLADRVRERQRRRSIVLTIEVPPVLFSDDLDALGRPPVAAEGQELRGVPVSAGVAEGPALVLDAPISPADAPQEYVLVCPSTDPAWVPLFLHAKALVMETGGVLSHGAIVAREFQLPAVVGIGNVHRRLRNGQRVRVDGNTGTVRVFAD